MNIIKDVQLKDDSKVNLVEIRNPSGSSQWKGRFSDTDSQSWSNVVDPNIRCMKLGLSGKAKIFKEKYTEKYTVIDDFILSGTSVKVYGFYHPK